MKLKRGQKLVLLALLIVLNVLIRIPSVPHEMGMDSIVQHIIANSVSEYGHANWWVNIFSVFGFYPYSTPSAISFLLSGLNQMCQIEMDISIWLLSIVFGIFSIFTSYVLAGLVKDDDLFKFFVAFAFSLSPGILYFTTWNLSLRGPFAIMLALLVYSILLARVHFVKGLVVAMIMFIMLAATHNLIYFIIVLIFAYFSALLVYERFEWNLPKHNIIFFIIFCLAFVFPFFTRVFIENSRYLQLQEIIFTNVRFTGILLIFSITGYINTIFKQEKKFSEVFLLFTILLFAPLLWIRIYSFWFVLLFSCLFIGIGLINLVSLHKFLAHKEKLISVVLALVIIMSVSMSGFYQHWRTKEGTSEWYITETSYNGGLWIRENIENNKRIVGNDYTGDVKIFAISEVATFVDSDIPMFIYGFAQIEEDAIVKHSPLSPIFYYESPYGLKSGYMRVGTVRNILQTRDVNSPAAKSVIYDYNLSYFMENRLITNEFTVSVKRTKNQIYDNGKLGVWTLFEN